MLSTLWFPSLNPIGAPSVVAVVVCGLAVIFTERSKRHDFRLVRSTVTAIIPLILFGIVMGSEISLASFNISLFPVHWMRVRSFPDADDFCASYVYLAFAFVISWRVWQLP